ncbi:hypothetical protein A0J61_05432 [Choanephora cucurbitarum]|uniref:Uncharacterized protein n=1 Tax=Choanephora cucurbitarum TaxID=101091 RepID=A0A1C7NCL6_9FUNG|nr:hypothetical protein A0J61_05432 [Choanephora cucurbitarum]
MKLTISTLLAIAASQLVNAQQVSVFTRRDSANKYYEGCPAIGDCNFTCVRFSDSQTTYLSYPGDSCPQKNGARLQPMYLYSKPGDPTVLDRVVSRDRTVTAQCEPGQSFAAGRNYTCSGGRSTSVSRSATSTGTKTTSRSSTSTSISRLTTPTGTKTTSSTTASASASPASTCSNKDTIFGKRKGRGYNGDCCKTQADCREQCIKGKCNGPRNTTLMSPSSTMKSSTSTSKHTGSSTSCTSGHYGLGLGDGPVGACCSSQWDCEENCVKGRCN